MHFIRECIDRLETLDVLVLMQADRARSWTIAELSGEMRSSSLAIETALATLNMRGLVAQANDRYSFRPHTPELESKTARLLACYRERRTAVIRFLFSAPNAAVRSFAEAFRITKGKKDG